MCTLRQLGNGVLRIKLYWDRRVVGCVFIGNIIILFDSLLS
jgi:hypothetical protein